MAGRSGERGDGADHGFVNLKLDHHFPQQDPPLIFAKNNQTLNILAQSPRMRGFKTPYVSNTSPAW